MANVDDLNPGDLVYYHDGIVNPADFGVPPIGQQWKVVETMTAVRLRRVSERDDRHDFLADPDRLDVYGHVDD